jgi:hypothetical protein
VTYLGERPRPDPADFSIGVIRLRSWIAFPTSLNGLSSAEGDPSVTRALPVLLWRPRGDLDMAKLCRLAQAKGRERTLGFFLDLAARLSGDRRFRSAATALRPSSLRASTNFFTNHQGPLARALADKNTPPVARSWGYRMNMGMDAFESMFAKANSTGSKAESPVPWMLPSGWE